MSFPISITWSGGAPPVAGFQQMAAAAKALDSSLQTTVGKMDQFGGSISQIEGPIGGVANGVGQLEGSISGLEGSIGGAASGMESFAGSTEQLNGSISETGGFVTDATGSMSDFGGAATDAGSSATEFGTAATDAGTGVTDLGTASSDTGGFVTEMGTAAGETNTVLGETNTVLGETVPAMAETATGAADTTTAFTELNPAVTDTTGALDSGIPIFEGAGTAAADAGSATDTFTGALSGMTEPLEGVTGGLDTNNTLMENLATSTGDTATESGTLNSSLTTLGTGLGTVTGSAMSLYSAYTNVRDAQAGVEKAQIKVIDANRKAESAFIKLGGAINKITSDTENHISGQARLAAAWAKVVELWNSGVRSGPQLAAALQELRAAQDGLSSSTAKGNDMIAKLNPQISTFESNSRKAAGSALGLQRANEGLVESMIGVAGSIVSGVSGLTQIVTQGGAAVRALGPLKGVFIDMGIVLSQTVIPALAGIAVPAAAAVGAIVGFIAAVTAIRANIKVFDDMGVAIGNVFPQLRGFLDDGRQAFINFSDAINSSISAILGVFDSLTGNILGAQKAWDGFTNTLPKGTANANLLTEGIFALKVAVGQAGEVAKQGYGKFKILENGTLQLANGAIVAAGSWSRLDEKTVQYTKTAAVLPGTQDKVTQSTDKTTQSTTQMSEATKKAADELAKVGTSLEEANAKVAFYATATKMAELTQTSFALGVAEAKVALIDEQAELAKSAGALMEHSRQLADGSIQALAYKEGIVEAGEALVEKVKALAQAQGAYDATNVLMKEGTLLAVEYASGMQDTKTAVQDASIELVHLAGELAAYNDEATAAQAINNEMVAGFLEQKKALIDLALEYAHTVGEIAALESELSNAAAAQLRFAAGLAEGKKKALEFLVGIQQAKGEAQGFHQEMVKAAEGVTGALTDMSSQSTKQLQRFMEVVAGVPAAFDQVVAGLGKFTQKVVDTLSKAGKDGKDGFMENIAAMEKELGQQFSKPLIRDLQLAVNIDKAKKDVETGLGILGAAIAAQPLTAEFDNSRVLEAIRGIEQSYAGLPASSKAAFAPLQASLNQLKAWDPGTGIKGLAPIMANILSSAENLGGPLDGLISAFGSMANVGTATAGEMEALRAAFASVNLTLDTTTGVVKNAAGEIVGDLGTMATGATGAAATTVTALDTLGPAGTKARTTLAFELVGLEFLMNRFAQEVKQSAIEVSTAFANMSTNTHNSLNTMASGFQIVIAALTRIQTDSQRMASTVSGSFSNMATNTRASMNTMASGFQVVIAAMTRIGQQAQSMNSTVSAAFRSATSSASSFSSGISSSMSRAGSAMDSAASKARALQSAINSLKSKTITITTVYVTIRRTIFAAQGGAFVTSSPTSVGPVRTSEFGQQELVTVTPLQTPGRQPVPQISKLIKGETEKRARRIMGQESEKREKTGGAKEVVMMRETPIIVQVDGREIARVVNKRIFEESDALV